jgi:hypothetical protein
MDLLGTSKAGQGQAAFEPTGFLQKLEAAREVRLRCVQVVLQRMGGGDSGRSLEAFLLNESLLSDCLICFPSMHLCYKVYCGVDVFLLCLLKVDTFSSFS